MTKNRVSGCRWVFLLAALYNALGGIAMSQSLGRFEPRNPTMTREDDETFKLTADFTFFAPGGRKWMAAKNSLTDGASIPWPLYSIVGPPMKGPYLRAAIVHDVYCTNEKIRKFIRSEEVHLMFYQACRAGGTPKWRAKLMYWAVYNFGPRWTLGRRWYIASPEALARNETAIRTVVNSVAPPEFTVEQMQRAEEYFKANDPSLEEIRELRLSDEDSP